MLRVRGRVARGHIVVDDAVDLPEGAELELVVVGEAWPPELDEELERRLAAVDAGELVDAPELIARLRAPR
jgi:hypothetical protein